MVELEFERRLERLFDEAPGFEDADGFAHRVETRLDRGWATRRLLIGVAGAVGGVVGVSQLLLSSVFGRLEAASVRPAQALSAQISEVAPAIAWLPYGGGMFWLAAAAAILVLGAFASRMVEEI
jgi:hypothetical protein